MRYLLAVGFLCVLMVGCGATSTPTANSVPTPTPAMTAAVVSTATNTATVPSPTVTTVPLIATATPVPPTVTDVPTSRPPTATIAATATAPPSTAVPPTSVPPPPTPTATPPPPIPTLVPQPTMMPPSVQPSVAPFQSDGVGATRMDWERTHRQSRAGGPPFSYDSDRYLVTFAEGSPPVIYLILRQYSKGTTVPIETARAEIRGLLPSDARLITTTTADGDPLEIYHSDGLIGRFPANPVVSLPWYNDDPGTFTVSYQRDTSNKIQAVYVGAGGTP